jgi:signal transduction histidine kinase
MAGEIMITSEVGKGTIASVILPAAVSHAAEAAAPEVRTAA